MLKTPDNVFVILLDVRNAFNTRNPGVIIKAREQKGIPLYLGRIISSFLDVRSFQVRSMKKQFAERIRQGSVVKLTLWNGKVLNIPDMSGDTESLARIDDVASIKGARSKKRVKKKVIEGFCCHFGLGKKSLSLGGAGKKRGEAGEWRWEEKVAKAA